MLLLNQFLVNLYSVRTKIRHITYNCTFLHNPPCQNFPGFLCTVLVESRPKTIPLVLLFNRWQLSGASAGKIWFLIVLRILDIFVWIQNRMRIRGSMPLTNGSGKGFLLMTF